MNPDYDPERDFAYIPPELDEGNERDGFFKVSAQRALLIKRVLVELVERQTDSVQLYRELPAASEFHKSEAFIRLLRGSNRAGKTLTAAVEFARAATGSDPYKKYPERNGKAFVFGLDGKHIGLTVFPKVFQPGAFQIIRDPQTRAWRAYLPCLDADRKHEAIPAPPLIPPRFIADIAWEEKKTKTPKSIYLVNGWELHFFSSFANMPQGQSIDLFWADEELGNEKLIAEAIARCAGDNRKGRGFWSCTPQAATAQLYELHEKAEDDPDGDVQEYQLLIKDNPYIDDDIKQKLYNSWSPEERRVRWDGEYAYGAVIVYPEFAEGVHGFNPVAFGLEKSFQLPYDWPIYFSVDPGRQVCAVAFWTVPPPKVGDWYLMFDELYIEKCDADKFGRETSHKLKDRAAEAWWIDHQAGRTHDVASGQNVEEQYRQALIRHKVELRVPGAHPNWGSNDPAAGILAFRDLLRIKPDGRPRFYVYLPNCPHFLSEIKRYRWKKLPSGQVLDQVEKRHDHLMDDCRYLAMARPRFVVPKRPGARKSPAVQALAKKRGKKAKNDTGGEIRLG